jgi:hypothetical protein
LVTALATGLGALPLLLGRRIERLLGLGTALAAGFMVGAGVGLFREGAHLSATKTLAGAVLGAVFIVLSRALLGERPHLEFGALRGAAAASRSATARHSAP